MGKTNNIPDDIKDLLEYDPKDGLFRWRFSRDIAGSKDRKGYIVIRIDRGCALKAHRLAWFYVHGVIPLEIDHINGKKADNRIANLREVTRRLNMQNLKKALSTNQSGYLGVSPGRKGSAKPWVANIQVDGKKTYLGAYATPKEAHKAYIAAKRVMHPNATL